MKTVELGHLAARPPLHRRAGWVMGIALVAGVLLSADAVEAMPFGRAPSGSDLVLVRDGCGRGMRFSRHFDECVPIRRHHRVERERHFKRDSRDDAAAAIGTAITIMGIISGSRHQRNNGNIGVGRPHGHQNFGNRNLGNKKFGRKSNGSTASAAPPPPPIIKKVRP